MQKFLQTCGWIGIGLFLFIAAGWLLRFLFFTFQHNLTIPVIIIAAIFAVIVVINLLLQGNK
ncbi:hypothetical protein [Tumidithrix elongata]|uniref:hypothetical protein n=1 Tax=Tumidithrix elongata TaxID=3088357 RepID=UPI002ED3A463